MPDAGQRADHHPLVVPAAHQLGHRDLGDRRARRRVRPRDRREDAAADDVDVDQAPGDARQPRREPVEDVVRHPRPEQDLGHPDEQRQGGQRPAVAAAPHGGRHDLPGRHRGEDDEAEQSHRQQRRSATQRPEARSAIITASSTSVTTVTSMPPQRSRSARTAERRRRAGPPRRRDSSAGRPGDADEIVDERDREDEHAERHDGLRASRAEYADCRWTARRTATRPTAISTTYQVSRRRCRSRGEDQSSSARRRPGGAPFRRRVTRMWTPARSVDARPRKVEAMSA